MRILKYLFLLILLALFGAAVFTATQKGDFDVTQHKIIPLPTNVVYSYVNDLNNWQGWFHGPDNIIFGKRTSGKGALMTWDSPLNDGIIKTLDASKNDSIVQKMQIDGLPCDAWWTFKDTAGGTKVTWRVSGKMGFMPKVRATMKGGPKRIMGIVYEQHLQRLGTNIVDEITKYSIKSDGPVYKPGTFYLKQSVVSKIENLPSNIDIMMSNLQHFFRKNKMQMHGKPFVLYDSYDSRKGITKFSVCAPIKEEVYISADSDITSGKLESMTAVRTILKGDHSHLREAWNKTFEYIEKNKHEEQAAPYLEVYRLAKADDKRPSQFLTEIYVPIKGMATQPEPVRKSTPTTPASAATVDEEISIP